MVPSCFLALGRVTFWTDDMIAAALSAGKSVRSMRRDAQQGPRTRQLLGDLCRQLAHVDGHLVEHNSARLNNDDSIP
jgi:hypothetical protein